ncbi:monocarboxylate transporter 12-like [Apostichopus japonicus]|uniref:monocarboxylate transporter 12-like n=1 Tax=Stichopus japonicus TaxID=307972 RepID=UPI003AB2C9EF
MAYVANPLSTPLYNRFGCRWVSISGVVMASFGLFLTSYVDTPWLLYFTYSLPFGMGTNFCYNPPLILTGEWFPVKYHVLSTCTLVAGIPFGSFVMNPLSEVIIHALGLKDALRILALVVMVIGIPCCLVFKQPPMQDTADDSSVATDDVEPPQPRSIYDTDSAWLAEMIRKETNPPGFLCFGMRKDLWTEPVFILFLIGQFTKGIGYVFPFVHLVSFMLNIGLNPATASLIMTIKGSFDMLGRLVAGVVGENMPFGLIHVYVVCTAAMGIATFLCVFASNFTHMAIYAVCIGFFNGVYNSLLFPTTTSLFNKDYVREAWAYCQVPPGIAIILGPGMAGFIYDVTETYEADFQANTIVFIVAMVIFACIPAITLTRQVIAIRRRKGKPERATIVEMTRIFIGIDSTADEDFDDESHVIVRSDDEETSSID